CLYFQMHTCSRPCNNDIGRTDYLQDVAGALAFIQGRDQEMEGPLLAEITELASKTQFEEAETLRRKLEKLRRGRQEVQDTFTSIWEFNYLALLPSHDSSHRRMAYVRSGNIVEFRDYDVGTISEEVAQDIDRLYSGPMPEGPREWQYDEFCLVSNFLVKP